MESTIRLKSYIWDIFEFLEKELTMYEYSYSQSIPFYVPEHEKIPLEQRIYVNLNLRQDPSTTMLYKREEYDLLTYFGELGGLLEIVMLVGWYLSFALVSRLLQAALVERTYRQQYYNSNETQYYETRVAGVVTPENSTSSDSSDSVEKAAIQADQKLA